METKISFKKRCGEDLGKCLVDNCPDVWELSNGDFAIIGIRKTNEFMSILPESAGCGSDEEIVLIPRAVMVSAKRDLPDS